MKTSLSILAALGLISAPLPGVGADDYVNLVWQIQVDDGTAWDVPVEQVGTQMSPLSINPGGARFELWTIRQSTMQDYLLDQKYVGTYVPRAFVEVVSEDPYDLIPRTRADRPFQVKVTILDLLTGDPAAPPAAKSVIIRHHHQLYGEREVGLAIDRMDAELLTDGVIDENGEQFFDYARTTLPGADLSELRGEERFTIYSLEDYQTPEMQLASQFVQIWPVATGSIVGIANGAQVEFSMPPIEIHLDDLYPDSHTYAQVYKGQPVLGKEGVVVPGSAVNISNSVPQDRVLRIDDWNQSLSEDGVWTLELVTRTPFGLERLDHVTFGIDRTLEVHGSVTTIE